MAQLAEDHSRANLYRPDPKFHADRLLQGFTALRGATKQVNDMNAQRYAGRDNWRKIVEGEVNSLLANFTGSPNQ